MAHPIFSSFSKTKFIGELLFNFTTETMATILEMNQMRLWEIKELSQYQFLNDGARNINLIFFKICICYSVGLFPPFTVGLHSNLI